MRPAFDQTHLQAVDAMKKALVRGLDRAAKAEVRPPRMSLESDLYDVLGPLVGSRVFPSHLRAARRLRCPHGAIRYTSSATSPVQTSAAQRHANR